MSWWLPFLGLRIPTLSPPCEFELGYTCYVDTDSRGIASLGLLTAEIVGRHVVTVEAYADRTYLGAGAHVVLEALQAAPPSHVEVMGGDGQRAVLLAPFEWLGVGSLVGSKILGLLAALLTVWYAQRLLLIDA